MMKKLLLADDSITIQKVVGIIFSTEEYQLEVTDDGDRAFTKALEDIPDLVIADISMPGKDGFELCRAIKNEPSLANTSVLLLPGAFDHFDEIKAGEVCADGWLTKPFESQALLDKVAQLLAAEPVKMAGVATLEAEEPPLESQSETSEIDADSAVDEVVLGLDAVDALGKPAKDTDEESPDDIWDTVSFAEDDLQAQTEPAELDSDDEDLPEQIEPVEVDFAEEDSQEQTESAEEDSGAEDLQEQIEPVEMDSAEEDAQEQTESAEMDSDDKELQEQIEPVEIDFAEEDSQEQPESAEMDSDDGDLPEQIEPVEVASAEDDIEPATDEQVLSAFTADDDEAIELQEEDEPIELESIVEETTDGSESTPELDEAIIDDISDDVDIYDLSEEDIVESESLEEEVDAAAVMESETVVAVEPEALDGVSELAEEEIELAEEEIELAEEEIELAEEEIELAEEEIELAEEEIELAEEEIELAEEEIELAEEEIELAEDIEPVSVDDEDETFYFDESIEGDDDVATVAPVGLTAEVAAVSFGVTGTENSATEQVEQQLRELSEDELSEVVSKVAGPIIEKLASEMLEKIAWEVVPDLAEAMISEEIRKIKEGV